MPRITLFDVDSRIPNLALMKNSAWHKARGWETALFQAPVRVVADRYVASAIFFRETTRKKLDQLKALYGDRIEIGGSGVDLRRRLPPDVDTCFPDYRYNNRHAIERYLRNPAMLASELYRSYQTA